MNTNLFSRWTTRFVAALMITLLALAAMPASPAYAGGVVGTGTPASCTEAAFDAALAGGGAVTFNCGGAAHTINITTTKTISADTTIDGGGLITLDAGGGRRHFVVNAGVSLGLSNLTIQNGSQTGGGGAIDNSGNLTINTVTFTNNRSTNGVDDGGAIEHNAGTLTISNSTFSSNYCYNNGGAIYIVDGTVNISGSTFQNHNNNNIDNGGAIYITAGTVTISGSAFSGNRAQSGGDDGGAIYLQAGTLTISDSDFTGNIADDDGGAIHKNGGALTIDTNSLFDGNYALDNGGAIYTTNAGNLTINDSAFQNHNNTNIDDGGAIYVNNGTVNIARSTFENNHAQSGGDDGGAIYFNGGTGTITNSTFTSNIADDDGGAIFTNTGITITGSTFDGNTATGDGGAVYRGGGTVTIINSTFYGNTAGLGGAIRSAGGTTNISFSSFSNNTANAGNGSDVHVTDAGTSTLRIFRSYLVNPVTTTVNCFSGADNETITSNLVEGNAAGGNACGAAASTAFGQTLTLANNGGSTQTLAISAPPPADWSEIYDAAGACTDYNGTTVATDQRGTARPQGAGCDRGAFELVVISPTTTTIDADTPDPSVTGGTVNVSVTVSGGTTPTGTVDITGADTNCTITLSGGTGNCDVTFTSVGAKTLTATYNPDPTHLTSSDTEAHQVDQAATTTTITGDAPDPSVVGQAVTVNYAVAVTAPGSGAPTGNVTVTDGVDSCTGTVAAGSCNLTFTSAGAKTLTATYAGDANFSGSVSTGVPHQVNQAATTTTITSDAPDPSVVGQAVTVNYAVAVTAPGSGTPTGNVTVTDGVDSCTGTVAAGSCSITFTSTGNKTLAATYAGDANFSGSTSAGESHQVNQAATTTTITGDAPDPSTVGQAVTVNYTVAVTAPGSGAPTGNVTVTDGVDSCTGTVAAGTCNLTLTTPGSRTLTATYAGDANFSGSTSAGVPHQVNQISTTTAITGDAPDASVVGQAVTVTYTVTPGGPGTPTGDVTVTDGVDSCTGTVAAGSCSLTLTTAGNRTLTATYAGDANFSGSTSAGEPHTVNQAATTTTITGDAPNPSVVGQAVTVNYAVAVTAPGSGAPTGNVTVTDGTDSCTGTVAAGSCNLTFTSTGSKTLTATYAGDANFNGSTSAGELHQVNPAATTTTITGDAPDPSLVGQAVTVNYTVAVTAPGSGTPTGNVTVTDGVDSCTGTVAAGSCSITFTSIGAKTLTATYAGDADFNGSTSASEPHTVNQAGTTTTITSDAPDPSVVGQAVTATYTVTPGGAGTPTGNVTVSDGVDSCTGTVAAGSCDITLTTAGARTLTAVYAGDVNFSGSTSAGEPHTVNSSPAFLSADNTTFTVGSLSVFTINASGNPAPAISHTSGALPTGILFTPGVGSATLSGTPDPGTAGTYTLTFLAANGISPDAVQTFTLTIAGGPVILTNGVNTLADTGDGHLDEGETVTVGLTQILVTFNKDVNNPTPDPVPPDPDDVTNPANYLLVGDNGDGIQTYTCDPTAPGGGVTGGDTPISVDSVIYTNNGGLGPFQATLNINGGTALPDGAYRLIVCGTTSIVDLGGLPLAGNGALEGTDFTRNFRVAIPAAGGGGGGGGGRTLGGGFAAGGVLIPVTGFAPGRVTDLSHLPVTGYHATGGATLEIPALKLTMPIVGVPFKNNTWDVNWLLNQAGWLEGSAFPGFDGNSVLTSHVTLPYGQAGPFAELHKLKAGDKIFVRAFGYLYVYEIKSVSKASASDPSILQHEDDAWLTLVTCADYNEIVETYLKRLIVKARLVQTQPDLRWHAGR
jgi:LPXTG-site transpeptidase (sortase) family protein